VRARKPKDPGTGRSSGRLGLTVLVATVAAFLLVGVAQAAAYPPATLNVIGTGSGEVTSVPHMGSPEGGIGEPPLECTYASPGPQSGICSDETVSASANMGLYAYPEAGSELASWEIVKGEDYWGREAAEFCNEQGYKEYGEAEFGGPYCVVDNLKDFEENGLSASEGVEVTVCFVLEGEGEAGCSEETPNLEVVIEEGNGTVVSNPAGIECEPTCSHEFEVGQKVTLTASPASGYLVKSWKKCDTGGVNGRQCTVTITEGLKTVGIKFYKVFSLEGSKTGGTGIMGTSPGGINCSYACNSSTALYKEGGLTLKAKPAKHFHFVKFQGGTGSAASCNGVTTETCAIGTFNSNSTFEEVFAEDA
jgi:hypothetical protein